MSNNKQPERSSSSQPPTVSKFFSKQKKSNDDNDESLKYFKTVRSTLKATTSSTSSASAVAGFINKPSSPKKVAKKSPKKTIKKPTTRKKKTSQADIRKMMSKDEQLVHKVLEATCLEDNLDPEDVQLALALSESIKDQQEPKETKLENPFQGGGKVQSVNAVLERFGFKTVKALTEIEQEILLSNKFTKRSKFQKAPTVLTRTSKEEREEMIQNRVCKLMDQELYKGSNGQDSSYYEVYSTHLQDFYMQLNGIAALENSEEPCDDFIQNYYVTDLFQPSFLQADYLLKDWNQIPGRDRSPQKTRISLKVEDVITPSEDVCEEEKEEKILNFSSDDIFADVESFEIKNSSHMDNVSHVSQQLDILHDKLSKTDMSQEIDAEDEKHPEELTETDFLDASDKLRNDLGSFKKPSVEHARKFSTDSDNTIEYEVQPSFVAPQSPIKIDLLSSDDENIQELTQHEKKFAKTPEKEVLGDFCDLTQGGAESSQNDSSDVINISDDEINYSIKTFNEGRDFDPGYYDDVEVLEIENICNNNGSQSPAEIENLSFKELLDVTSNILQTSVKSRDSVKSNQSMHKFLAEENLSDSIERILKKYGTKKSESPKRSSFRKYQSESSIKLNESASENFVDLTQNSNEIVEELENSPDVLESSINKSLVNIINSPAIARPRKSLDDRRKSRKSVLTTASEKYEIDTENVVPEPDFKNMTPAELKQELFKYGIRPLPVKKAVELLQHIYNSIHPKIRVAAEEEIDANDSRVDMNHTDMVSNIVSNGTDDDFVFQYQELEGEEYFMPTSKKSKHPSCAQPLQIAFYNMIRSNPKLQKFILEFRPLDLDGIHKHFKKFGLRYQLNDIIAILDKRCITFKTKDQSYSKTHEAKKQKRLKRSQKN